MKKLYGLMLIPVFLTAQDLTQLVNSSLENKLVQSSQHNIQSIKSNLSSTQRKYLPQLNVGVNYSNTNKETASSPDSSTTSYASVSYVVYDGGKKYATYNSLESNIKSGEENLNSLKNSISLDVISYYFEYLSLVSQKEAKQKEIETLMAEQGRLQRFLEVGTTTSDEVDKIVSTVQSTNVDLHEIELNIQTILHNLEYLTASKVDIQKGSSITGVDSIEKLLRSDLKALEHDMEAKLQDARSAKSTSYPTISVDNTYSYYDMDYENKAYDSNLDDQNIFKVNLSWNLYDFGASSKAYESGYRQYQSVKSKYEYEKNKANVDLKLAFRSFEIGKLKISSAQAALKAANSTYEVIESKYRNGLVDNIAYLDALSQKYNAQSSLKSAKYDLEIKKAKIIYNSGKNVWEYIR